MGLTESGKQIGLFGGSFDPPHNGHLALVQAGLTMGLKQIYVIPALPVHRELSGLADARTRFNWLAQIFKKQPEVQMIDWEIRRGQPTPAIETLRQFQRVSPETVPWLLMGADAWGGLPTWREYPAHLELCNVLVFARRGLLSETVCGHIGWRQSKPDEINVCQGPGHWVYAPTELPDISATALRHDAAQGKELSGRVPDVVRRQIECAYGRRKEKM